MLWRGNGGAGSWEGDGENIPTGQHGFANDKMPLHRPLLRILLGRWDRTDHFPLTVRTWVSEVEMINATFQPPETETRGREGRGGLGILGWLREQSGDWRRAMEWGLEVHIRGSQDPILPGRPPW